MRHQVRVLAALTAPAVMAGEPSGAWHAAEIAPGGFITGHGNCGVALSGIFLGDGAPIVAATSGHEARLDKAKRQALNFIAHHRHEKAAYFEPFFHSCRHASRRW